MASKFENYQRRRLLSSYFSVVISIALVLFLVGLLGLLVLNSKGVADHFKEQIAMTVYFKESAKDAQMEKMTKDLDSATYTRVTKFVSKDEAAKQQSEDIGEDFVEFLGHNPLQNSIDVFMKADFVSEDQVKKIADSLATKDFVEEISYDQPLITLLNENIKKISLWIMIISGVFTFIAVLLINSSIRLSVYSKRFTIKTMQMVGATKGFIRRPFVLKSVKLGIFGALIALAGMAVVLYYLDKTFPLLHLLDNKKMLLALFGGVFLLGIVISWLSTFIATQRFLNLRTDELYY